MEEAVAHLSVPQQCSFAAIVQGSHRYSDTTIVERETSYSGILSLWDRFSSAQLEQDPYVPALVSEHPKLQSLFESFHSGGIGIVFLLSHAETVLCMFQHEGIACHVEFEAPFLRKRIKEAMWDKQIFSSMCFSWVYPG